LRVVPTMSESSDDRAFDGGAAGAGAPATDPRRRARKVFLILALIWIVGLEVPQLISEFFVIRRPGIQFSALGGLVETIPIAAFLVVTLRQPRRMGGAYWFLPLYFAVAAVTPLIFSARLIFSGLQMQSPVMSLLGAFVSNSLPLLVLAGGLWYSRPRTMATEEPIVVA
jgi:hypothetical protein